jgi:hypothetical protein
VEDTKWVRNLKSYKDGQHNGTMKNKNKRTNNAPQNTTQKTTD